MSFAPLQKLLENTDGRQRRLLLMLAACALLLILAIALRPGKGIFADATSRTYLADGNELTVAVHDALYERFDTPGTPVSLNLAIAREFADSKDLKLTMDRLSMLSDDYEGKVAVQKW